MESNMEKVMVQIACSHSGHHIPSMVCDMQQKWQHHASITD
jgi:hypothetical protein